MLSKRFRPLHSKMEVVILMTIIVGGIVISVDGACTFPPTFTNSTWLDNTKGTLTFTTSTMSGWSFTSYSSTVSRWECLNSSFPGYLVLKAQDAVVYSSISLYAYMCLKLTQVTEFSYIYYQMSGMEGNAGWERLKFSRDTNLGASDVCDSGVSVPVSEYHLLLKSGHEEASRIECPASLSLRADYAVTRSDNTSDCSTSADLMDGCATTTEVTFNYTTCSTKVAFSDSGQLSCMAVVSSGGVDYVVLYNKDAVLSSDGRRFACLAADGSRFSVAPNNCTWDQVPGSIPMSTGHKVTLQSVYDSCGSASAGANNDNDNNNTGGTVDGNLGIIIGLVVGAAFIIAIIVVVVIVIVKHKGNKIKEKEPVLTEGVNKIQLKNGNWVNGFGGAVLPTHDKIPGQLPEVTVSEPKTESPLPISGCLLLQEIESPRWTDKKPLKAITSGEKVLERDTSLPPLTSRSEDVELESVSKAAQETGTGVILSNIVKLPKLARSPHRKPPSTIFQISEVLPPVKRSKPDKQAKKKKKKSSKKNKKMGAKKGNLLRKILELADTEHKSKM